MMLQENCNSLTDIILKRLGDPTTICNFLRNNNIQDIDADFYTIEAIAGEQYKQRELAVTPEEPMQTRALFKKKRKKKVNDWQNSNIKLGTLLNS